MLDQNFVLVIWASAQQKPELILTAVWIIESSVLLLNKFACCVLMAIKKQVYWVFLVDQLQGFKVESERKVQCLAQHKY